MNAFRTGGRAPKKSPPAAAPCARGFVVRRLERRIEKGTETMMNRVAIATIVSAALMTFAASASAQMGGFEFCKADAARLCPGIEPGGGRLIKCMKAHKEEVSIGCAKELKKLKG
jgi:hypothetical protein